MVRHAHEYASCQWEKQSEAARNALLVNPVHIRKAINAFHAWAERYPEPRFFWCTGPHFDYALYAEACRLCNIKPLFEFWAVRDVRTAKDLVRMSKEDAKLAAPLAVREKLVDHHALSDCIKQTYEVLAARERAASAGTLNLLIVRQIVIYCLVALVLCCAIIFNK